MKITIAKAFTTSTATVMALAVMLAAPFITPAQAVSSNQFKAGRIIDDVVFTNKSSMSEAQIRSFIDEKVYECNPDYTCLEDYRENPTTHANNLNGTTPSGSWDAAKIIWRAAQDHDINPQVLLVTLQKENGLVTHDWPSDWRYTTAMGYGCPDGAPCSEEYFGFYNQVNKAAWQFRRYITYPDQYNYGPGNRYVLWHPDAGRCGGKTINIETLATGALYNYTPYQPNSDSLNSWPGTGNSCSSYGNRNFWFYFNIWFGPTTASGGLRFLECSGQKFLYEGTESRKRALTTEAISAFNLDGAYFYENTPDCDKPTFGLDIDVLVRSRTTGKTYLVHEGKAYEITSSKIATAWGYHNALSNTQPQLNGSSINQMVNVDGDLPILAKSPNTQKVYFADNQKRFYVLNSENSSPSNSLRLVTGDTHLTPKYIPVSLILTLSSPAESTINYSFTVGSNTYLLDHGKTKKIASSELVRWQHLLPSVHPALTESALSAFSDNATIDRGFRRNTDKYYRALNTGILESTPDKSVAENWGVNTPNVTQLLKDKLLREYELENTQEINHVEQLKGNVRLIQCGNDKYLVERFRRAKRLILGADLDAWGLSDNHFFTGDSGCDYATYSLDAGSIIRSRNTGKEYFMHGGRAYYIHNQQAADEWGLGDVKNQELPQFDAKSIQLFNYLSYLPGPDEI